MPKKGLPAAMLSRIGSTNSVAQFADCIGKRPDTGQYDFVGCKHRSRIATDFSLVPDFFEPLLDAPQVAHLVVDDQEHGATDVFGGKRALYSRIILAERRQAATGTLGPAPALALHRPSQVMTRIAAGRFYRFIAMRISLMGTSLRNWRKTDDSGGCPASANPPRPAGFAHILRAGRFHSTARYTSHDIRPISLLGKRFWLFQTFGRATQRPADLLPVGLSRSTKLSSGMQRINRSWCAVSVSPAGGWS